MEQTLTRENGPPESVSCFFMPAEDQETHPRSAAPLHNPFARNAKGISPTPPRAAGSFPASSGQTAESVKEPIFSGFHLDFLKKWSIVLLTFPKGSGEMPEWPKGTVC